MNIYKLSLLFFTFLILVSCSKSDSDTVTNDTDPININDNPTPTEKPTETVVSGSIKLPEGSGLNLSSLTVLSSTNNSTISNGRFELDVYGDYTALYVTDSNDNVFLIGYKYPGSTDNNITPTSTALGMLMMSPAVLDLSEQGKRLLINRFLEDSNFQILVEAIEQNIVVGNDLFDSNNTAIMEALVAVFQSSSSRSSINNDELPVFMARAGRNFVFNAGQGDVPNVYNTTIGIYKDGARIDKIKVEGVQIVPSSLSELFQGGGGSIGDPIDKEYTLPGDGDFTFKFRTGKPGTNDGSTEHEEAFYDNLGQFCYNLLVTVFPFLESTNCAANIVIASISALQSSSEISSDTKDIGVLLQAADIVLGKAESIIGNCVSEIPLDNKWLFRFLKHWNFVSTAFGVIANGANTTIFGTQWIASNSITDLCFNASGNIVEARDCLDLSGVWRIPLLGSGGLDCVTGDGSLSSLQLPPAFILNSDEMSVQGTEGKRGLILPPGEGTYTFDGSNILIEWSGIAGPNEVTGSCTDLTTTLTEYTFSFSGVYKPINKLFEGEYSFKREIIETTAVCNLGIIKSCGGLSIFQRDQ
ncbi:hypothetical protein [Robiginitalea sp. IMCC43444]|uniref:hypothetical protein n=1 Tax=Robiginitalea sp. IMCC43444 TaxID=3459121 RepID=UPI004041EF35